MKINCSQYVHGDDKTCQRATEWLTGRSLWGQTQNLLAGLLVWLCTWDSLIVYSYTLHIFKYCYIDINKIKLNGIKFDSTDSVCGCAPSKCLSVFLSLLV